MLVKQDSLVQKTPHAILKSVKAISEDVSLQQVRKVYVNKAFKYIAYAHRKSISIPHLEHFTDVLFALKHIMITK